MVSINFDRTGGWRCGGCMIQMIIIPISDPFSCFYLSQPHPSLLWSWRLILYFFMQYKQTLWPNGIAALQKAHAAAIFSLWVLADAFNNKRRDWIANKSCWIVTVRVVAFGDTLQCQGISSCAAAPGSWNHRKGSSGHGDSNSSQVPLIASVYRLWNCQLEHLIPVDPSCSIVDVIERYGAITIIIPIVIYFRYRTVRMRHDNMILVPC